MVSGSMRSPSPVRNQPLKSAHHTRLHSCACANGCVYGAVCKTLLARHHQTFALQQGADGAGHRPVAPRLVPLQNAFQFPRSPAHVRLSQFQHLLFNLLRCLVVVPVRGMAVRQQPCKARSPIPAQSQIPGLAGNVVTLAEFAHRVLVRLIFENKS